MASWIFIIFAIVLVAGLVLTAVLMIMFIVQSAKRSLSGQSPRQPAGPARRVGDRRANVDRVCPNDHCRHPNRSDALYCGQCGRRL